MIRNINKNYAVSFIRMIATIMVFGVHVCQRYNWTYISDWINLGVQLFFCISAYLYCNRNCSKVLFWWRRYITIIVPVVITVAFVLIVVRPDDIWGSIRAAIGLAGLTSVPAVFLHLWYITYILAMYALLPLLERIHLERLQTKPFLMVLIGVNVLSALVIMAIGHYTGVRTLSMTQVSCFVIPYYLSKKWDVDNTEFKRVIKKWMIAAIVLNIVTIIVYYDVFHFEVNIPNELKTLFYLYTHTMIGIPLFYISFWCIGKMELKPLMPVLNVSDMYSYHFYIVHYIIIMFGALSLVNNKCLSIMITFAFSLCASVVLKHISMPIIKIIRR